MESPCDFYISRALYNEPIAQVRQEGAIQARVAQARCQGRNIRPNLHATPDSLHESQSPERGWDRGRKPGPAFVCLKNAGGSHYLYHSNNNSSMSKSKVQPLVPFIRGSLHITKLLFLTHMPPLLVPPSISLHVIHLRTCIQNNIAYQKT